MLFCTALKKIKLFLIAIYAILKLQSTERMMYYGKNKESENNC